MPKNEKFLVEGGILFTFILNETIRGVQTHKKVNIPHDRVVDFKDQFDENK